MAVLVNFSREGQAVSRVSAYFMPSFSLFFLGPSYIFIFWRDHKKCLLPGMRTWYDHKKCLLSFGVISYRTIGRVFWYERFILYYRS